MDRHRKSGDELRSSYPDGARLETVFRDIEGVLKNQKQVVCQYIVNGMALEEKEESRFASLPLTQVESLEYLCENSERLLLEVVDGWMNALPEMIVGAENLAESVRGGKHTGLIKPVHDLVENCEFLIASLISGRGLLGDSHGATLEGFDRVEKMTRETVSEAVRRLEAQDLVQLALVIEYDLNHCLQEWMTVLNHFRSAISGRDTANDGTRASDSVDRKRLTQ